MATCSECQYNLPYHGRACSADPAATAAAFCPAHQPQGTVLGSDDQQLRCSVCGVQGYDVKRVAQ